MESFFWKRLKIRINKRGIIGTMKDYLFILHLNFRRNVSDSFVLWKNKDNFLSNDKLVDLPSHTVERNRKNWDTYDWLEEGEQWVPKVLLEKGMNPDEWKNKIINEIMLKYFKKNSTIIEIGSGAGRWTEILQPLAKKLIVTDIAPNCIKMCKKRFKLKNNLDYKLIDKRLDFIDDNVIDYVWSFSVFVHINPSDVDRYIEDFSRILKPGGIGIIHHCGTYSDYNGSVDGWRAFIGAKQFHHLVEKHGMKILDQTTKLVRQGDVISIFTKPSA